MLEYGFFLDLAIILLCTKLFGTVTRKIQLPAVVGALLAGFVIGPNLLNIVHETEFIDKMAELGVIFIMFMAGMETDLEKIKQTGKASLLVAFLGVLFPLIGGVIVTGFFSHGFRGISQEQLLEYIFIGVILMATSVTISVETLRETGRLNTKSGTTIVGAALIDDIFGIVALTVLMSVKDSSTHILIVLLKIVGFFVFAGVCGYGFYLLFKYFSKKYGERRRVPIYSLVFCLLLSYSAEHFFGVADITGAYLAGAIISSITLCEYVNKKMEVTSYMLFAPIFFASIGIKAAIHHIDLHMAIFASVLIAVALLTKVAGGGIGAKMAGYNKVEALRCGVGMMARGEVALIVVDRGVSAGLVPDSYLTPIVLLVIASSLLTPALLKWTYKKHALDYEYV
ncbi:MAG: cation:proton antiporter [Clostridia bacterium]|nr:cation:proton antiporter [Clostridia bacterium]